MFGLKKNDFKVLKNAFSKLKNPCINSWVNAPKLRSFFVSFFLAAIRAKRRVKRAKITIGT